MKKINDTTWMYKGCEIELTRTTTDVLVQRHWGSKNEVRRIYKVTKGSEVICPVSYMITTIQGCKDAINEYIAKHHD